MCSPLLKFPSHPLAPGAFGLTTEIPYWDLCNRNQGGTSLHSQGPHISIVPPSPILLSRTCPLASHSEFHSHFGRSLWLCARSGGGWSPLSALCIRSLVGPPPPPSPGGLLLCLPGFVKVNCSKRATCALKCCYLPLLPQPYSPALPLPALPYPLHFPCRTDHFMNYIVGLCFFVSVHAFPCERGVRLPRPCALSTEQLAQRSQSAVRPWSPDQRPQHLGTYWKCKHQASTQT